MGGHAASEGSSRSCKIKAHQERRMLGRVPMRTPGEARVDALGHCGLQWFMRPTAPLLGSYQHSAALRSLSTGGSERNTAGEDVVRVGCTSRKLVLKENVYHMSELDPALRGRALKPCGRRRRGRSNKSQRKSNRWRSMRTKVTEPWKKSMRIEEVHSSPDRGRSWGRG